ncbi:MAG: hypothetical protein NZZ41_03990 [Candidatus Dojkabacteria bacterium]|nr:hypothetical protein [Candidatus Dojkabacteria bacterium]
MNNSLKLLKEAKTLFPHLPKSYIYKNQKLLKTIIQSYKESKKYTHFVLIESSDRTKKKYIKDYVMTSFLVHILKESSNHNDFVYNIYHHYTTLFEPVTRKYLIERENVNQEKQQRPKFDPLKELDPKNKDDQNPDTVAYWERVANEEPKAPDIQPFIKYLNYYKKGYNVYLIYNIPDDEPGGGEKSFSAKTQKKLYDRYKFKQSIKNLDPEQQKLELAKFDVRNNLKDIITNSGNKVEYDDETYEQAKKNPESKVGSKKQSFFSYAWGKVKKGVKKATLFILKKVFGGNPEAQKYLEQLEKIKEEKPQEVESLWTSLKNAVSNLWKFLTTTPQGKKVLKTIFTTILIWLLQYALTFISGPIGAILVLSLRIILAVKSIYSSTKEVINIVKSNMKEGETGFIGVIKAIFRTLVPRTKKDAVKTILFLFHATMIVINAIQLYNAAKQLKEEVVKLLEKYGISKDQAQQMVDQKSGKDQSNNDGSDYASKGEKPPFFPDKNLEEYSRAFNKFASRYGQNIPPEELERIKDLFAKNALTVHMAAQIPDQPLHALNSGNLKHLLDSYEGQGLWKYISSQGNLNAFEFSFLFQKYPDFMNELCTKTDVIKHLVRGTDFTLVDSPINPKHVFNALQKLSDFKLAYYSFLRRY